MLSMSAVNKHSICVRQHNMEHDINFFQWIHFYFFLPLCFSLVLGHEENCDYLDISQQHHTGYLQCHENGCCGDFKDRHCCVGPIVTVAIVFGALFGTLIVAVIVGVCYAYCKKRQMKGQVIPTIVADSYNDIPLPSPPVRASTIRTPPIRAPPVGAPAVYNTVYNTARLHPPVFAPQPFRNYKNVDQEIHPPPSTLHPPRLHRGK